MKLARSKAYLVRGVEIRWSCDPKLIGAGDPTPAHKAKIVELLLSIAHVPVEKVHTVRLLADHLGPGLRPTTDDEGRIRLDAGRDEAWVRAFRRWTKSATLA